MFEADAPHLLRIGEPEVYRDPASPIAITRKAKPMSDASAFRTEVKAQAAPAVHERVGPAHDAYPLTFKVIGPKRTVAPTRGAIAGGRRFGECRQTSK